MTSARGSVQGLQNHGDGLLLCPDAATVFAAVSDLLEPRLIVGGGLDHFGFDLMFRMTLANETFMVIHILDFLQDGNMAQLTDIRRVFHRFQFQFLLLDGIETESREWIHRPAAIQASALG